MIFRTKYGIPFQQLMLVRGLIWKFSVIWVCGAYFTSELYRLRYFILDGIIPPTTC